MTLKTYEWPNLWYYHIPQGSLFLLQLTHLWYFGFCFDAKYWKNSSSRIMSFKWAPFTNINFAYSVEILPFSKRSVCPSKFSLTLHWPPMVGIQLAYLWGVLLYASWWIAENVLDASLCFVFWTLAVNQLRTRLSSNPVQKLGDFSCILEQFPAETNAAGQTSICGSEWGSRGWDRGWARAQTQGKKLWQKDSQASSHFSPTSVFLIVVIFHHWRDPAAWNVSHPDCAGQVVLLSVSDSILCQCVSQLAEMKLDSSVISWRLIMTACFFLLDFKETMLRFGGWIMMVLLKTWGQLTPECECLSSTVLHILWCSEVTDRRWSFVGILDAWWMAACV